MALPKSLWIVHVTVRRCVFTVVKPTMHDSIFASCRLHKTNTQKNSQHLTAVNGGSSNDCASGCFPDTTGNDSSGFVSVYEPPHTPISEEVIGVLPQ